MKNPSLVNWSKCKKFMLDYSAAHRFQKFTRVSDSVRDDLEGALRMTMRRIVDSQPSVGKTIKN